MTDVIVKNFDFSSSKHRAELAFESNDVPAEIHDSQHLSPGTGTLKLVGANLVWRVGEHSVEFENGGDRIDDFLKDRQELLLVCMAQGKIRYLQAIDLPLTEASPAPVAGQDETDPATVVPSSVGAIRPKAF